MEQEYFLPSNPSSSGPFTYGEQKKVGCVSLACFLPACQHVSHLPLLLEGAVPSAGPQDFATAEDEEGQEQQLEEQRQKQLE